MCEFLNTRRCLSAPLVTTTNQCLGVERGEAGQTRAALTVASQRHDESIADAGETRRGVLLPRPPAHPGKLAGGSHRRICVCASLDLSWRGEWDPTEVPFKSTSILQSRDVDEACVVGPPHRRVFSLLLLSFSFVSGFFSLTFFVFFPWQM